jgi:hypothetical protein
MPKLNGFIGPSYTLQSTNIDAQRAINLYAQMDESGVGKNIAALLSTPGLRLFCNVGTVPRGLWVTSAGRVFVVENVNLWELNADGTKTARGTLTSSAGYVGIADNGTQLMLVDGPNGYGYDLAANTLTPISDFPGGETVTFQDGYCIFNVPNTQQFYITALNDVMTIDPLDTASMESSPDTLFTVISDHQQLWGFGSLSIEVWYDSGAELFPFARVDGGVIPHGVVAKRSPARFDNSMAWLGKDDSGVGIVWKASGYQPVRISTFAVEQAIARYPRMDDASSWTYQHDGHAFYCLNFPSGGTTWVYDASSQLWHERAYTGELGLERARPELHVFAFGKHLVTDYANGNIYVLDPLALNDNGTRITKRRAAPYVSDELKNLFISRLQFDIQTGTATDMQPEPQAMLDWSDDGGHTWSNERWSGLGAIGENKKRVIYRRLGSTRERVFRLTITDDVPVALVDAFIQVEEGTS